MDELKNFKLVKLNIEKNQEMVEKMGIDSVPTLFLVYKGKIVDSIIGFPDEERLEEFFLAIISLVEIENEENQIKNLLKEANDLIKAKMFENVEEKLNKAFSFEKCREKYGPAIKFGLGQ
jgi:thioredoxin-like negative regulator of GroEL